jgi:hypothetical protein
MDGEFNGSGTVVQLTFKALKSGSANFEVYGSELVDADGNYIQHSRKADSVAVSGSESVNGSGNESGNESGSGSESESESAVEETGQTDNGSNNENDSTSTVEENQNNNNGNNNNGYNNENASSSDPEDDNSPSESTHSDTRGGGNSHTGNSGSTSKTESGTHNSISGGTVENGNKLPVNFIDLPNSHWAYEEIVNLVKKGIIKGYQDGTFSPDSKITRAEFMVLVGKGIGNAVKVPENYRLPFTDSSKVEEWAIPSVTALSYMGYVKGDASGKCRPSDPITRAEIITILVKVLTKESEIQNYKPLEYPFTDIAGNWARDYIGMGKNLGLVSGYGDGSFCPDATATRAESSLMAAKFFKSLKII